MTRYRASGRLRGRSSLLGKISPWLTGLELAEGSLELALPAWVEEIIMKATELLETQHRKVKAILSKLEKGASNADALLEELASDLAGHMIIEQELFYPAALPVKGSLVLEGFEEHAAAEDALKRLLKTAPEDTTFKAKATVLKELIQHHVEEEEEEVFPKVEKSLGEEASAAHFCKKMKALFDESIERRHEAGNGPRAQDRRRQGRAQGRGRRISVNEPVTIARP